MDEQRVYPGRVIEVVDGDTVDVEIDMGLGITNHITCRIKGVDTHETYGVEETSKQYKMGMEEASYTESWLSDAPDEPWPLAVTIHGRGGFGRYITTIEHENRKLPLADALIAEFGDELVYEE